MKVLFDTNVILDLLLDREPFSTIAAQLLSHAEAGEMTGYVCATTLTTIHYLATKTLGSEKTREELRELLAFLEVAPVNRSVLESALQSKLTDFEDAVLCESGRQIGVDAIATRNARDFTKAGLPVHTPEEVLHFFLS